jgi:hypothetical protein
MTGSNQADESNEVVFHEEYHEQVGKPANRSSARRAGIVAGSALLFLVGAVAMMGASPAPATGADPAASAQPDPSAAPAASGAPGKTRPDGRRFGPFGRGGFGPGPGGFGGFGAIGFRDIAITAINGSDLSLKTDDGWTRTITVASTTTITKGGATIKVGDLAVGDQIHFAETKAADGSYSITAIVVVLPTIVGQVKAIDGDTLTVTQPGGATATIHVDGSTTYRVNGQAGSLSDLKVGSFIGAEGTQRSDGSLDAAAVRSGFGDRGGFKGPGFPGHRGQDEHNASPAESSGAS